MNTAEFLTIAAAIVADRPATIFEGRTRTYGEMMERTQRLASALAEMGVGAGDRVATLQVNTDALVETYFAATLLDAIYVPLNFRAKEDELTALLNSAEPTVLFAGERYLTLADEVRRQTPSVKHYVALDGAVEGWLGYEDLLAAAQPEERFPTADDNATTILMFTAGTTGAPKAVMLPHGAFSSYVMANVAPPDPDQEEERNLISVPLYHIAGLQAVLTAVYGGRTIILQRQFEPGEWMQLVERYKAHRAMMVPTMLRALLDHPEFSKRDLSSLRVITYGAAAMPLETIRKAIAALPHVRFINAFGQTETASTITMLPPEDHVLDGPPEEIEKKLKRLTSIGKPLEDVEVQIVDEDGNQLPPHQEGEIVARGPRIMKGYWRQDEATKQTLRSGWLYTGDRGYRDDDGYIFLAGRAKDFIKRGGEMIAPEEVERVLMSHPSVDDAAVIGVRDAYWGERVRAIVVLKAGRQATERELSEHCRERLASYKKPESVVFVSELPRNPLGKVLKRLLRDQFSQPVAG